MSCLLVLPQLQFAFFGWLLTVQFFVCFFFWGGFYYQKGIAFIDFDGFLGGYSWLRDLWVAFAALVFFGKACNSL